MSTALDKALSTHRITRGVQTLLGMITGIVADHALHDGEIALLRTWLGENSEIAAGWPGSAIAAHLAEALADGHIDNGEREHLLRVLTEFAATDFGSTGTSTSETISLPYDDAGGPIEFQAQTVCHTGEFMYGTRAKCERLTTVLGATPVDSVSKKTSMLVVGARVSPNWVQTSYGRKIEKAIELRAAGHRLLLLSERRWFEHAQEAGKAGPLG